MALEMKSRNQGFFAHHLYHKRLELLNECIVRGLNESYSAQFTEQID